MGKSEAGFREAIEERRDSEGGRTVRLQQLILEEVNFLLRSEVADVRLQGVVVTFVQLAGDGSCARLWFTAEDEQDRTEALERAAGFFRGHLADSLALKRTPELRFRRDPATRAGGRTRRSWPCHSPPSTDATSRSACGPRSTRSTRGVIAQLKNVATLPWVAHHVAVMPDVHVGKGATVGSVIAMHGAVAPAAVGVDIGCGMAAVKTSLTADDLPDDLRRLRTAIEQAIPVGRAAHRDAGLGGRRRRAARGRGGAAGGLPRRGPRRCTAGQRGRLPARHARRRQPLHRGVPGHRGQGLADAALGQPRTSAPRWPSTTWRSPSG